LNQSFDTRLAPDTLFRVARKPRVWAWIDLKYTGEGRWDDPERRYAVLYASRDSFGAYLESLSHFQPDLELVAQLKQTRKNAAGLKATAPAGRVPADWRSQRLLGRGAPDRVGGAFVAVGRAATLAVLRRELAPFAHHLGIEEIDAGVIRLDYSDKFRAFTQAVSRFIYEQPEAYAGIFYLGQRGDDVENYAILQRGDESPVSDWGSSEIDLDDEDFLRACRLLGIEPA
jgi:RES domain